MTENRYQTMTEALRELILADETSFRQLGFQTGLTRQSLMLFANGTRSLRLDLADKLATHYGLEVVQRKETI